MITDLIGAVLVLVVLICIIWIMVRPARPSSESSARPWVGAIVTSTFLQGLLCALAMGALVQSSANPWLAGITAGATVGGLFALTVGGGDLRALMVNIMSLLFGVVGLVFTIALYFTSASCTPADVGQRLLGLVVVLVALVGGGALSFFRGFFSLSTVGPTVLALFGTLGVVEFLSSPLGVSVVDLGVTAWIVALAAALALGFAAPIWPNLVITVASVTMAVGSLLGSVVGGVTASCLPGRDLIGLAPIIGFTAIYLLVRAVLGRALRIGG